MGEPRTIACKAEMNYLGENVTVTVEDGRADPALTLTAARLDDDAGWARRGFALYRHRSAVKDWTDEAAIDQIHRREIAETAQALTGCTHALPYPAILRNPAMAETVADYAPIHFVHSDFTEDYGRMIGDPERTYQTFLGPLLASEGLRRIACAASRRLVQFWRNVGRSGPMRPWPFAMPPPCGAGPGAQLGRELRRRQLRLRNLWGTGRSRRRPPLVYLPEHDEGRNVALPHL